MTEECIDCGKLLAGMKFRFKDDECCAYPLCQRCYEKRDAERTAKNELRERLGITYVAGKMSGIPDYNYPAFHAAAKHLRDKGIVVRNPADTDNGTTDKPREFYLREALKLLLQCDTIALLEGWEDSRGACLEVLIAGELGIRMVDAYTLEPLDGMASSPIDKLLSSPPITPTEPPAAKESILQEAQRLVHGDRGKDYGHPFDNHSRTAAFWSTHLGCEVTAEDVCWMNVLQKISRDKNAPKRDNPVDAAGYSENVQMVRERRAELENEAKAN